MFHTILTVLPLYTILLLPLLDHTMLRGVRGLAHPSHDALVDALLELVALRGVEVLQSSVLHVVTVYYIIA